MAATTIAKGTWELRSNQEFTITSGSGKTVTCTPAAPMVGMAALVQRLAAAGLLSRIAVMEPGMFGVMEPVSDCRTGLPKGLKDGIILPLLRWWI